MGCYWVYIWLYHPLHGSNSPDCQVSATSHGDAVVAAMQRLQLSYIDYAYVARCGVVECETFSAVSLPAAGAAVS